MIRLLFISASILIFSSCCKKRYCPNDDIPFIVVKISEPLNSDNTVTLYELNGAKTDSTIIYLNEQNPYFHVYPVHDYDDPQVHLRKFIIRRKNQSDTIHSIAVAFQDVEVDCSSGWGCGNGLGKEKITLKKLTQFGFAGPEKYHGLHDTLVLN